MDKELLTDEDEILDTILYSEDQSRAYASVWLPDTVTLAELREVTYWPKGWEIEEDEVYVDGRLGYWIETFNKTDYLPHLIKTVLRYGGGFLRSSTLLNIGEGL